MKQRQYLKDYRPSPYRIPAITLRLDIQDSLVEVHSRMQVEWVDEQVPRSLRLDGRQLDLHEIRVDDAVLPDSAWSRDDQGLTLHQVPARFELAITVRIDPYSNSSLEGLYFAGGMLCSQCESHGFSRITYFPDRPDVLSVYTVELEAEQVRFPVLLSNGNPGGEEELPHGRHRVRWHDPHPKPCYLFAVVAGELSSRHRRFTTSDGREVAIGFYCDAGIEDQLEHAMDSLERAMRWDEQRYGLACDLDTYNVVVAAAFNMGAMENKGLNIFNPKYVLARPDTATDRDYADVESVIGHEYFHNWTGNRVTCRDWFQLSLKEGLTVFRDQQFSADCGAGPVQRIDQVRMLRGRQFAEDAGPLAHPVRPESYLEMNNFYTLTVYEKGAELVRLLHARLGEAGFRKGMDLYIQRHDGQAVTIEDFLAAHADANDIDTSGILRWYAQAGTPLVTISDEFHEGRYQLRCRQEIPGRPEAQPVLIPIRLGLLDGEGEALAPPQVLEFDQPEQHWEFSLDAAPTPALFEGLSAPVRWEYDYSDAQLETLLRRARDPFSRWEAAQRIFLQLIDAQYNGGSCREDLDVFAELLDDTADGGVIAALLSPPRADELTQRYREFDPLRLVQAVDAVELRLAGVLAPRLPDAIAACQRDEAYRFVPEAAARRSLQARLLQLWVASGAGAAREQAVRLFDSADNLTTRMMALSALNRVDSPQRQALLQKFYERHVGDRLVLDRWFALQAQLPGEAGQQAVRTLLEHQDFDPLNPNRVRALLGSFGTLNLSALYAGHGAGLHLLAEQILRFDALNPQLAARLVTPCAVAGQLAPRYREPMQAALAQMAHGARSPDVMEQVERIMATI